MGSRLKRIVKYRHTVTMILIGILSFIVDFGSVGKAADAGSQVTIFINGNAVGVVSDTADVEGMIREARKGLPQPAISWCSLTVISELMQERMSSPSLMTKRR